MYYAMRASAPSLHRESTDSLIHEYDITSNSCFATCKNYSSACMKLLKRNLHPKVQPIIKSNSPKQILQPFETVEIEINIKETNSQLITLAKATLFFFTIAIGCFTDSSSLCQSKTEAVVITAVVCVVCSFTAGLLLGVLVTLCNVHYHKKQKRDQTERPPVYEDIPLEKKRTDT